MVAVFSNNATGNLGAAIATGDTSLILQTKNGDVFPSPSGGDYFPLTVLKADGTFEIMKCTSRANDVLTVVRSQEGTTAKSFSIGDRVSLRITAKSLSDFVANKQPLNETLTSISNSGLAGMVVAFAMQTAPSGFLKANGAAVSRTLYAALFAAIGTTFGAGDGSTTFNLPDFRGEHIRGWDDGRGVDSGRVFGSWQDGQNLSHTHIAMVSSDAHTHTWSGTTSSDSHSHTYTKNSSTFTSQSSGSSYAGTWYGTTTGTTSDNAHTHTVSGTTDSNSHVHAVTNEASGGDEVRVRNRALLYCIKY